MASGDFLRNSIVAERNELRMTKVVIKRPFKELDHRDQFRLKPAAFPHILRGPPLWLLRPTGGKTSTPDSTHERAYVGEQAKTNTGTCWSS
jgi:hypothetical protein